MGEALNKLPWKKVYKCLIGPINVVTKQGHAELPFPTHQKTQRKRRSPTATGVRAAATVVHGGESGGQSQAAGSSGSTLCR